MEGGPKSAEITNIVCKFVESDKVNQGRAIFYSFF